MRTAIKETVVYTFEELSETAKEKATMDYYNTLEGRDYDAVIEDAEQIAEIMGFSNFKVLWSGFGSQGDGACFEADWSYPKGMLKKLKEHAPPDKTLHNIADILAFQSRRNGYKLSATIRHGNWRYYHKHTVNITIYRGGDELYSPSGNDKERAACEGVVEACKAFMGWIWRRLQAENDYFLTEEYMADMALGNKWEFTEDGSFYH